MYIEPIGSYLSGMTKINEQYLTRSLKRLSSGIWVNSSADSGMMSARKAREDALRSSLGAYAVSIEDRISLGETADSSLKEINSVIGRMKELAVSATSSSRTQSDRIELNNELSLLKDEIDKLLASTEYNTKKLLNGQLAGIVTSTKSAVICASVTDKVKTADYNAEIYFNSAAATQNHVLTTNIFSVKTGLEGVSNSDYKGIKATVTISAGFSATGSVSFNFSGDTYTLNLAAQAATSDIVSALNSDSWVSSYLVATYNTSSSVTLQAKDYGTDKNGWRAVANYSAGATTAALSFAGGTDSINGITLAGNPVSLITTSVTTERYAASIVYTSAFTETASDTAVLARFEQTGATAGALAIYSGAVTAPAGGGYLAVEIEDTATITTAAGTANIRYSLDGGTWNSYTIDKTYLANGGVLLTDGSASVRIGNTAITTMDIKAGDKHLFSLPDRNYNPAGNHIEMKIYSPASNGLGSTQNSTAYSRTVSEIESGISTFNVLQLDTLNGDWINGSIDLQFSAIVTAATAADKVYFHIDESGGTANEMTPLSSIGTFFDSDGNFLISTSGDRVTLKNMAGDSAYFDIYPATTVGEVRQLAASAISTLFSVSLTDEAMKNLVTFATAAQSGSLEATAGKFILRSPLPGVNGEIYAFAENDNIENAFSFTTLQEASGESFIANIGGTSYKLSGGEINSAIPGVSLKVKEDVLVEAGWSGREKNLVFDKTETLNAAISVHDSSIKHLASVYGGSESFAIPDFSLTGLGLNKIDISTINLSQRAQTIINDAAEKIGKYLGTLGGEIERSYSRLDLTNNLSAIRESAYSSLFSTDVAMEYTEMTKRLMLQSTVSSMFGYAGNFNSNLYKLITL